MGEGGKKGPLSQTCLTYPEMMKFGTIIPYLKKIQQIYKSRDVTHPLSFAGISIFKRI